MNFVLACMSVHYMCLCWGSQKREKDLLELEVWLVVNHHVGVGELNQILCQKQNNKTKQKLNTLNYWVTSLAQILSKDKIVFNICACGADMLRCVHGKVIGQLWESVFSFHRGSGEDWGCQDVPAPPSPAELSCRRFWNLTGYLCLLFSQSTSHAVNLKELDDGAVILIPSYGSISAMFYLPERLGFIPCKSHYTRINNRQQGPPKAGLEDVCVICIYPWWLKKCLE